MRRTHKSFGRKSDTENSLWNRRVGRKITFMFFACVQNYFTKYSTVVNQRHLQQGSKGNGK